MNYLMRKIVSKYKEDKKRKRNQLIVGFVLIFIMFFSVLGYSLGGRDATEDSNKINYNGFEFENQNGFWVLNMGNFDFIFRYNPEQVEKSYSLVNPLNNYYQKPLYVSSESIEAESEIYINLNQIVLRMQPACLEGEECEDENMAVKTCADNFIIIRESNFSNIIQEENCVFIKAPQENLTRITDEFLFKILGVE